MRLRRMSALFWAGCLVVCCFVLYVMTDLTLKLPSRKTEIEEADDKWIHFENKLKHIESALNEHHAVVGEIRSVVEQYVENTNPNGVHLPPNDGNMQNDDSAVENKAVLKMPSQIVREILMLQPYSKEQCNVKMDGLPHADVQMLSVYDRITFDDIDGGVWKQGWRLEYEPNQWNRKKKLRVFIVPHSHNDPGWIKTFEDYYRTQTKSILSNIVSKLSEDSRRTFIWAETSFLSLWWNSDATLREKTMFKSLLTSGQLEIVSGGWVMNDEANSHWLSIVQQLTTGHQWLMDNIKVLPKIAWQIDPFGHSSTQPYLNKLAGMEGNVIQRVHYRIKKELGLNKQLEFRWRQIWDGKGGTDLLTHMFPFYSYDVPHSCGPDPKVCCQFDFKRLPGNSAFCPWRVNPQKITTKNVDERARLILDQWRKKSQLYKSNVVMFPLGDDFRWDRTNEWDNQFSNYDKLLEHLNNNEEFNAEVKFGTLTDYFNAVHEEMAIEEFPILSGDFFTYADRNQHYWSGYYTSRPFYKHMDRIVLGYVRAAEMLLAQATANNYVTDIMGMGLKDRVERARRWLSLFQHHDGVTGTARDPVVKDYGNKLQDAIQNCQHVIQLAAYFLLAKPEVERFTDDESFFTVDDIWRQHSELPEQIIITIDPLAQTKRVILHNPLPFQRWETVTVTISTPFIEVLDSKNEPVLCQVSPIILSEATVSTTKYLLTFTATVKAMALTTYIISATGSPTSYTTYAKLTVYNDEYTQIKLPPVFIVDQHRDRQDAEFTMRLLNSEQRAVFSPSGLLKAVSTTGSIMKPLHMDFVSYGSQRGNDNNSGAYLFIPDGHAQVVTQQQYPVITVIEGQVMSRLHVQLRYVKHKVTLYNNPSKPQADLEVSNILNLTQIDDYELAMRLSTNIKNGNEFFTDLNGMQMIKRRYFEKLPVQANFYPLPAAAYIQDEDTRLTVLTSTPLGVAALQSGQIEIMQDRRLARDDNRGLNQGVLDNLPTLHTFHILMEGSTNSKCQDALPVTHPSGRLTLAAHLASQTLLQPILRLHYSSLQEEIPDYNLNFAPLKAEPGVDVTVVSYRSHLVGQYTNGKIAQGSGITLHRTHLDFCYGNQTMQKWYPLSTGEVNIMDIIEFRKDNDLYESSLTYNQVGQVLAKQLSLKLCPMEVRSFFVNQTLFSKERN